MSSPDRPPDNESSRWRRLLWTLEVRERWRVFCDECAHRLNAPGAVGGPTPPVAVPVRLTDQAAGAAAASPAVRY